MHKDDDGGSGEGSPDPDVVEPSRNAQGDPPRLVDDVVTDAVVDVGAFGRCCLRPRLIRDGRCLAIRQRPVRPLAVVVGAERVEEHLELVSGVRLR